MTRYLIYAYFQAHLKTQDNFWGVILHFTCPFPQEMLLTCICPHCFYPVFMWVNGESPIICRSIWISSLDASACGCLLSPGHGHQGKGTFFGKRKTCNRLSGVPVLWLFPWSTSPGVNWHNFGINCRLKDWRTQKGEEISLWLEVLLNFLSYPNHTEMGWLYMGEDRNAFTVHWRVFALQVLLSGSRAPWAQKVPSSHFCGSHGQTDSPVFTCAC